MIFSETLNYYNSNDILFSEADTMTEIDERTILLVEDEVVIAMAEAAQLKKMGYHTLTAHNAAAAVETVETHPDIHLILMDIDLGRGKPDGTEAAAEILSRHQVPVVFLSSHTEPEVVEKTEKITSYGYIVKNSGLNVLDRSIKMALKLFDAHQEVKKHQTEAEEAYWEMERREERLQHTNRILLSIRNVNQLITKETNPQELLDGACRLLIETNGYHNASIVLLKAGIPREPFFHAGTQLNYPAMEEELRKGNIPPCIGEALQKGGIIVMNSAHHECSGCPLMENPDKKGCMDENKAGLTSRLEYNGTVYGWLMVTLPERYSRDSDEHRLFAEITGDLSFALNKIELEKEKNRFNTLLLEKEQVLNDVFESIQDGISVLNKDLTIQHTNGIMKRWYTDQIPLEGKKCYTAYQNLSKPCEPCPSLRCIESGHTERNEIPGLPGSPVEYIELFSYPMKDPISGEITGVVEFIRDITHRKEAEELLKTERRRLNDVLEGTNVGIWEWNVQTNEVVVNKRWAEIIGYTLEEVSPVSFDTWARLSHPEDLERSNRLLKAHMNGDTDFYSCDVRMRHKSGKWIWVQDRGRISVRSKDGTPLLLSGTHLDISDRKKAEEHLKDAFEEKGTLLKELKHRVKNNFSMIINLLRLKVGSVQTEETRNALDEIEGRVRAFSELYNQLYREDNLNTIHLSNYFQDLLEAMSGMLDNLDIRIDMDDVFAPLKEAGTLGIIITELVSNAIKHSFPSGGAGTLYVELGRDGKKTFLSVKNNGLPFPEGFSLEKARGFGLTMTQSMAEDMGGSLEILTGEENGVRVSFELEG